MFTLIAQWLFYYPHQCQGKMGLLLFVLVIWMDFVILTNGEFFFFLVFVDVPVTVTNNSYSL